MEDLLTDAGNKADVAIGAASAGASWFTSKLDWWKNHPNKLVKVGVAVGVFIGVALILTLINQAFV